jgi:hypothetical protein
MQKVNVPSKTGTLFKPPNIFDRRLRDMPLDVPVCKPPQEALDAALGTEETFAAAKDTKRQAMALGNQAAALEALHRYDEALTKYEQSAELFGQIDEGDLRAMVMKSAAAIKLKTGKITESAFKMMGSLDVKKNPGFFERILKFFMRFIK